MSRLIWTKWLGHRAFSRITSREFGTTRLWRRTTMTVFHEQLQLGYRQNHFTSGCYNRCIHHQTYRALESVIPLVASLPGCRQPRRFVARILTWAAAARWIAVSITTRVSLVYRTERRRCHIIGWSTALRSRSPMSCRSTQLVSRTQKCGTTVGQVWSRSPAVKRGVRRLSVLAAVRVIRATVHSRTSQQPLLTLSKIHFIFARLY